MAQAIALRHRFGHVLRTGGLAEAYLAAGRVEEALPLAQLYVQVATAVHLRGIEASALRLLADVEIHRENPDTEAAMQALPPRSSSRKTSRCARSPRAVG